MSFLGFQNSDSIFLLLEVIKNIANNNTLMLQQTTCNPKKKESLVALNLLASWPRVWA